MSLSRVLFSSKTPHYATPAALYAELDAEFHFTLDPCPLEGWETGTGTVIPWAGYRVYCNPPYGRGINLWLAKAREAECAVYLLPARTDTAWWHDYALKADEIRFIRGRLKFGGAKTGAPFPSVILVYRSPVKSDPTEALDAISERLRQMRDGGIPEIEYERHGDRFTVGRRRE